MTTGFEQMWQQIAPIGKSEATGGYFRLPWTQSEIELRDWFKDKAAERELEVVEDSFGNLVAWWGAKDGDDKVITGSHFDAVLDGGGFDGPLGIVSAFAALDELRSRGFIPNKPLGIAAFVAEEGSRFGRACLGSRLAVGSASWDEVKDLTDREGVRLEDVCEGSNSDIIRGVSAFVELHIEQGRALVDLDEAVGIGSSIWPHGRYRFEFKGRADHAGTTRMEDRADPMVAFSLTAVAANKQARLWGQRATFGRIEVKPNGTNAVPSEVVAWLDARAESAGDLENLVDAITRQAVEFSEQNGVAFAMTSESVTAEVVFDANLRETLNAVHGGIPLLPTQAGHDAGILQEAGIPSAMLFVRNPSGTSHSPAETAEMTDCNAGVLALANALAELLS